MSDESYQSYLDYLREEADGAEAKLFLETDRVCPGTHVVEQHRDRKPPWCKACGRTNRGVLIITAGMAWFGKARLGRAGLAGHGAARQGLARRGRQGKARPGTAGLGSSWQAWQGLVRRVSVRHGRQRTARLGPAGLGWARHDVAGVA